MKAAFNRQKNSIVVLQIYAIISEIITLCDNYLS